MHENKTKPNADAGPVDRLVGRLESERAEDGALLVLAADAAGLRVLSWLQDAYPFVEEASGNRYGWNPLVFDSHALRLAAALRLTVGDDDQSVRSMAFAYARHRQDLPHCYEPSQRDPAAAYRRAIVRAAAALADRKLPIWPNELSRAAVAGLL